MIIPQIRINLNLQVLDPRSLSQAEHWNISMLPNLSFSGLAFLLGRTALRRNRLSTQGEGGMRDEMIGHEKLKEAPVLPR